MQTNLNEKGFSLVELMVVVAIIGLLAAIALPQYERFVFKTRRVDAFVTLKSLYTAEFAYYGANSHYLNREWMGLGNWQDADQVYQALGIDPGFRAMGGNKVFNQYNYQFDVYAGCDPSCTGNPSVAGRSFLGDAKGNLDNNSTDPSDNLYIKVNASNWWHDWGYQGPDGTPLLYHDDLTNRFTYL